MMSSADRQRGWMSWHLLALRTLAVLLVLGGCATLPPPIPRLEAFAFDRPETTELGQLVRDTAPEPGLSGFRLLMDGQEAMGALLALAGHASEALDLKYYIVRNDASARTVLREVHSAAERGVRVRILVDDLNTASADESLLCLTRHPNIELRLYNPFPAGRFSTFTRVLSSLTDLPRINRRMHGKMMVADNTLAVTGGRNLGDEYFVQSPESNFVDLDILAGGPVVPDLSAAFDRFWNSPLAYPIGQLVTIEPDCAGPVSSSPHEKASRATGSPRGESGASAEAGPDSAQGDEAASGSSLGSGSASGSGSGSGSGSRNPDVSQAPEEPAPAQAGAPVATAKRALADELDAGQLHLTWLDATLLADKPGKIERPEGPLPDESIADDVAALIASAERELILITPYFVPGPRGMALFRSLRERGVSVRVITNTLASTDAPIVHIGYARYRPALLELGVELYEMRNWLEPRRRSNLAGFGHSEASLHAKAVVVDRKLVLAGSMNMDPRSANLNSEIALVLPSATLAEQLAGLFEEVASEDSYRLELRPDGRIRWVDGAPDTPDPVGSEPNASAGLRFLLLLLSPFAPEQML
jgi:putative cardiolipin synthase